MLSKSKRAYNPQELPPDKRLRANIVDLLSANILPGQRSVQVLRDIASAGVAAFHPFEKLDINENACRFLSRRVLLRNI